MVGDCMMGEESSIWRGDGIVQWMLDLCCGHASGRPGRSWVELNGSRLSGSNWGYISSIIARSELASSETEVRGVMGSEGT